MNINCYTCSWFDGEKCDGGTCESEEQKMSVVERYEQRVKELEKEQLKLGLSKKEYERIAEQLEHTRNMLAILKRME